MVLSCRNHIHIHIWEYIHTYSSGSFWIEACVGHGADLDAIKKKRNCYTAYPIREIKHCLLARPLSSLATRLPSRSSFVIHF
jgi:hypothetical protein